MIPDKLFIMRFNDGSATGQLKGIKKDEHNNWLVCDLTADGNDVVTSTCVSMATFSLTGVSLEDLLFVELYLKGDEANTLWKWMLNLEIELFYMDSEGIYASDIYPSDGRDKFFYRYAVAKTTKDIGEKIELNIDAQTLTGEAVIPPEGPYPPASGSIMALRSFSKGAYYYISQAPLVVTHGTLASVDAPKGSLVLYDDPVCFVLKVSDSDPASKKGVSEPAKACVPTIDLKLTAESHISFTQVNGGNAVTYTSDITSGSSKVQATFGFASGVSFASTMEYPSNEATINLSLPWSKIGEVVPFLVETFQSGLSVDHTIFVRSVLLAILA